MGDVAVELAHLARATPLLDASPSLDVLVDVLLERGIIAPPWPPSKRRKKHAERDAARSRLNLLQKAWEWADEATLTEAARIGRAWASIRFQPYAGPAPIIMSPENYRQLRDMLGAGMISVPDAQRIAGIDIIADPSVPPGTIFGISRQTTSAPALSVSGWWEESDLT